MGTSTKNMNNDALMLYIFKKWKNIKQTEKAVITRIWADETDSDDTLPDISWLLQ